MNLSFKAKGLWTAACLGSVAISAPSQTNLTVLPPTPRTAVSELNGKLDYSGGDMDTSCGSLVDASISLPITHQFGFQADGLYSRVSTLNFGGGAAHAFWRDPNIGLVGLTGGYLYRDGNSPADSYQAGVEAEYYLGRFTLGGFAGVGSIDYNLHSSFAANPFSQIVDTNPTRFVGRLSVDYYPIDNLRVGASYTSAFENNLGRAELEYQTPINGLALTSEIAYGDYGYHHWLFGIRYYFGGHKTLSDRQRQDDPPSLMRQIMYAFGGYGDEFNHKVSQYLSTHSESGGSGGEDGGVSGVIIQSGDSSVNWNNSSLSSWTPIPVAP